MTICLATGDCCHGCQCCSSSRTLCDSPYARIVRSSLPSPERLVDWLTASALIAGALGTAFGAWTIGLPYAWLLVVNFAVVSALIFGYHRSQRVTVRRALVLVMLPLATLAWIASVGPMLLPLQILTLVLLVREWSIKVGIVFWIFLFLVALVVYQAVGRQWWQGVLESIGVAALTMFGLVFAVLLRSLTEARDRDLRTVAALDATNARLQRSLDIEKELVLADERARMSRELHDGLGHRLTLISMRLELADRISEQEPDQARAAIVQSRALTREAIDEMRIWVRALNPIRESGLRGRAAMEAIADSFRTTGLTIELTGEGAVARLGEAASLVGYRIVQEGLTNALRHSSAKFVSIEVSDDTLPDGRSALRLSLSNPLSAAADSQTDPVLAPGSFGLRSLTQRAEEVGGTLTAGPQDGDFVLTALLPKEALDD